MITNMKNSRWTASALLLGLVMVAWAGVAQASHFRFGIISWVPRTDISPTTVEFTVRQAWRWSACQNPNVGDPACVFSNLNFGDGASVAVGGTVVSIDPPSDWYSAVFTVVHTYPSAGPWVSGFSNCCRIYAPQVNAPGTSFLLNTTVDLRIADSSPSTTMFPIVPMGQNQLNVIPLAVADADGDTLTCRLANFAESGIANQPGPPLGGSTSPLSVTPDCQVVWDTAGTSIGQLWATQIIIEQSMGGAPAHGTVALEFLIEIVASIGTPPMITLLEDPPLCAGGVDGLSPGDTWNGTFEGTDSDLGDLLTLNSAGLPAGASCVPSLPTSPGPSPVSTACSWTPTVADAGVHPIVFGVTDLSGQQDICGFSLLVALRCDVDGDFDVDRLDIGAIFSARNTPASGPSDPRDADGDGVITVNDGRQCVLQCTNPRCATQ